MKRHEALRPLSRDHHFLLRHAQALARAGDEPLGAAWRAYAEFRRHDLAPHVQEEELLSRACGVPMPPLTAALDPAAPRQDVVDSLRRHVRVCEEETFPMAEANLGDSGLRMWSEESARFRARHRRAAVCDIVERG